MFKLWSAFFTFVTVCSADEVTNLHNLNGTIVLKPLIDSRENICFNDTTFQCDFTTPCPFGGSFDSPWYQYDGLPDLQIWSQSVGTSVLPDTPAIAVQLGGSVPYGLLSSDPIPCVANNSRFYLKFWSTKNTSLSICILNKTNGTIIVCSNMLNQLSNGYPGSVSWDIPDAINEYFVIQFMASAEPEVEGFVILDDIYFYSWLCDSPPVDCIDNDTNNTDLLSNIKNSVISMTNYTQKQITPKFETVRRIPPTPPPPPPHVSKTVCQRLPCDFQSTSYYQLQLNNFDECASYILLASLCKYITNKKSTTSWVRDDVSLTHPVVSIINTLWNTIACPSGFGCATKDPHNYIKAIISGVNNDIAILTSAQFDLSNNKQLKFKYFRPIAGQTIKICFETNSAINNFSVNKLKKCDEAIPPFKFLISSIWNVAMYRIPNTATKFHLVALNTDLSGFEGPIAIGEISVVDC